MRALLAVAFCAFVHAGSITISVAYGPSSNLPITLTLPHGNACYTATVQNCVGGTPSSNTITTSVGTAQSSSMALTDIPYELTTQGSVITNGSPVQNTEDLGESSDSNAQLNFLPPTPASFTSTLNPTVLVAFSPDSNQTADAQISITNHSQNGAGATYSLLFDLQGPTPASFSLNPATGIMSLTGATGDTGRLWIFQADPTIEAATAPLTFYFANGIVTTSVNNLGLALPSVGSPAAFSLGYTPFQFLENGGNAFIADVGQSADISTAPIPEPVSVLLIGTGLAALILLRRHLRVH